MPATPVSGDIDCVRCTGSLPALTDEGYRGSVARYVWDLADRARSGWVVPMGASGDPRSSHHLDQLEAWAEARLLPIERLGPAQAGRRTDPVTRACLTIHGGAGRRPDHALAAIADPSKTPSLRARRRLASARPDDAGIHQQSSDPP